MLTYCCNAAENTLDPKTFLAGSVKVVTCWLAGFADWLGPPPWDPPNMAQPPCLTMESDSLQEEIQGSLADVVFACEDHKLVLNPPCVLDAKHSHVKVQAVLLLTLRSNHERVAVGCCMPLGYTVRVP